MITRYTCLQRQKIISSDEGELVLFGDYEALEKKYLSLFPEYEARSTALTAGQKRVISHMLMLEREDFLTFSERILTLDEKGELESPALLWETLPCEEGQCERLKPLAC